VSIEYRKAGGMSTRRKSMEKAIQFSKKKRTKPFFNLSKIRGKTDLTLKKLELSDTCGV
jgi:hypothetical protein